jgi:hypothetical protein
MPGQLIRWRRTGHTVSSAATVQPIDERGMGYPAWSCGINSYLVSEQGSALPLDRQHCPQQLDRLHTVVAAVLLQIIPLGCGADPFGTTRLAQQLWPW